jgi:hypothetical protein
MKLSSATLLLLGIAPASSSDDATKLTTGWDQEDPKRMLQGKKGGSSGGKKGDCVDDATIISTCSFPIFRPGRYVVDRNLICDPGAFGIGISADDVHLDCQGNKIRGNGVLSQVGIGITASQEVTVSNCDVSGFPYGLQADIALGRWTDLTVRDSSFTNNIIAGMNLSGPPPNVIPSEVTVVNSKFNDNGNIMMGAGIVSTNVEGTFYSSTMNDNIGINNGGFIALGPGERTLVDVTANGNAVNGIIAGPTSPTLKVINSIACNNQFDMVMVDTAQANTCDLSTPPLANGFLVCQCTCDGSPSNLMSNADAISMVEDVDGPFAWLYSEENPFAIRANETVAAIGNL